MSLQTHKEYLTDPSESSTTEAKDLLLKILRGEKVAGLVNAAILKDASEGEPKLVARLKAACRRDMRHAMRPRNALMIRAADNELFVMSRVYMLTT